MVWVIPLVRHATFPRSRHVLAYARPAAPVKAGRLAAPLCGVALTGADRGAPESDTALVV